MTKAISEKNTKTEILEAYQEMLAKNREQKAADQKAVRKEAEEKGAVASASGNSVEDIVRKLAALKLEVVKSIDGLEERLIAEYKRFTELQQAIIVQSAAIEEMYGIQVEAGALSALVLAQKEKREAFEREMEEKKAAFDAETAQRRLERKKEQDDFEVAKKERDGQLKKERQREEEEYSYTLKMERKKDTDSYEARKASLESELATERASVEKDLAEREADVASGEKELEDLRARADLFPKELEKAIRETEKSVTERIEFKYKHQAELSTKEVEGERKLNAQIIGNLERKIAEQEELIQQLTRKADESVQQVQAIAVKAIEGASTQRILTERPKDNG